MSLYSESQLIFIHQFLRDLHSYPMDEEIRGYGHGAIHVSKSQLCRHLKYHKEKKSNFGINNFGT